MGYTLGEAKTRILTDLLDDPDKVRWDDAAVVRAVRPAISRCANLYVSHGGDKLRENATQDLGVTTPAGSFIWDAWVGSSPSEWIGSRHVSLVHSSGVEQPLKAIRPQDARVKYTGSGTVKQSVMGKLVFPTVDADYLVSPSTGDAGNVGGAFDDWVCVTAALDMESKEREKPSRRLEHQEARLREAALGQINSPATSRFPGKSGFHPTLYYAIDETVLVHPFNYRICQLYIR